MNMELPITYSLLVPIKVEGKTYTEITLRRPKCEDLKAIERKEGIERSYEMLACLSGWPYDTINELDALDFLNIKGILEPLAEKMSKTLDKMKTIIEILSVKYFKNFTIKINNIDAFMKRIVGEYTLTGSKLKECKATFIKAQLKQNA
ncbi:phage tail assembly protein [Bartonella sp. B39]